MQIARPIWFKCSCPSMCLLAENAHTMKITMLKNDNAKWNTE